MTIGELKQQHKGWLVSREVEGITSSPGDALEQQQKELRDSKQPSAKPKGTG